MAESFPLHNPDLLLEQLQRQTLTSQEILTLLRRYGMLPHLLQELLIDQAVASIQLTDDELLQARQQFCHQHQLESETALHDWLTTRALSRDSLDAIASRSLRLERYKQKTWGHKLEPYFLQRKSRLDRVVYSLIRVKEVEIAQELFFRIQESEQSFSDLAQTYSQGAEAQTGGLIGPVELSVPHPTLANLLASSQPGQLIPPTRMGEWIVIVRLEQFLPAQLDDSMRQRLLNELCDGWLQEQIQATTARLNIGSTAAS